MHSPPPQIDEVRDRLSLDWRRYLALFLWYVSPSSASPAQAVHQYQQAVQSDAAAPRPTPIYMDERASLGRCRPCDHHSPSATDLHHELLSLWAAGSGGGGRQREALAALLQAAAHSPNPLDGSLAWHVMTALQAVGVLPTAAAAEAHDEAEGLLLAAQLNLITQLRMAGGMCEWAVYVALHVPDNVVSWPGLRGHLVRELLAAHCPEWRADAAKLTFLKGPLGLPQVRAI